MADESPMLPDHTVAAVLRDHLLRHGGCTIDARSARTVDAGLAVCADPAWTLAVPLADWHGPTLLDWVRRSRRHVVAAGDDLHLGAWHPTGSGVAHLDVVRVVPADGDGLGLARSMGRRHRQHALFDLTRRALVLLEVS